MRRGIPNPGRQTGSVLNTFALLNEQDEEQERQQHIEKLRRETESLKNKDWADVLDSDCELDESDDPRALDNKRHAMNDNDFSSDEDDTANAISLEIKEAPQATKKAAPKKAIKKSTSEKKPVNPEDLTKKKELRAKIAAATKKQDAVISDKDEDPVEKKKKAKAERKETRKQYER